MVSIAALAGGLGVSTLYDVDLSIRRQQPPLDSTAAYFPEPTPRSGAQLLLVYVGSGACRWCRDPRLPGLIERAKLRLDSTAHASGMSFRAIGLSVDRWPESGLNHLRTMGRFDEISAGYLWGNTSAMQYVWSSPATVAATPQVLVYRQVLISPRDSGGGLGYKVQGRQQLLSRIGLEAITSWVEAGAPVADLSARESAHSSRRGVPADPVVVTSDNLKPWR